MSSEKRANSRHGVGARFLPATREVSTWARRLTRLATLAGAMSGRFQIRTFGCQMNQHDAEKMSNLLHHEGLRPTPDPDAADVILVHTCSVREKAEQKLYSELGALLGRKRRLPGLIVGVGGCVAQQEGGQLLRRFPGLDFVFVVPAKRQWI